MSRCTITFLSSINQSIIGLAFVHAESSVRASFPSLLHRFRLIPVLLFLLSWYAEDCLRIERCGILKQFERHFQRLLSPGQKAYTFPGFPPSAVRVEFWERKTSMKFSIAEAMTSLVARNIACPKCSTTFPVCESIIVNHKGVSSDLHFLLALLNATGTGYLQQEIQKACPNPSCDIGEITKGTLALRKLAGDIASPNVHLA